MQRPNKYQVLIKILLRRVKACEHKFNNCNVTTKFQLVIPCHHKLAAKPLCIELSKDAFYCLWFQVSICKLNNKLFPLLDVTMSCVTMALIESYSTSSSDKCHYVWMTVNCQWHSWFFLSWNRGRNIYYLCPIQPLRNNGPCFCMKGHGSSIRRHIPLCLCGACWDLLGDSVTRAEVEGFLQPAAWLPACPFASRLNGHWSPSSDTMSQGRVSRYTSLPPTIILPL